jgi:hypothetical protein
LAVQFGDIVPRGCAGIQQLVFEPAEQAKRESGSLRQRIGDFVRFVKEEANLLGSGFLQTVAIPVSACQAWKWKEEETVLP